MNERPDAWGRYAAIVVLISAMSLAVIYPYTQLPDFGARVPGIGAPVIILGGLILAGAVGWLVMYMIRHEVEIARAHMEERRVLLETIGKGERKIAESERLAAKQDSEIDRLAKCSKDDRETIEARIEDLRKAEGEVRTKTLIMNACVANLVAECARLHETKANAVTNPALKEMRFRLAEVIFSLVSAGGARLDNAEARSLAVLRDWLDEEVRARPGNFNESNPRVSYFVNAVCVTSQKAIREKADAEKAEAASGGKITRL